MSVYDVYWRNKHSDQWHSWDCPGLGAFGRTVRRSSNDNSGEKDFGFSERRIKSLSVNWDFGGMRFRDFVPVGYWDFGGLTRSEFWHLGGLTASRRRLPTGAAGLLVLERVEVECGHDAEVGHVLCQSLRCARDFEKHKNILMKL